MSQRTPKKAKYSLKYLNLTWNKVFPERRWLRPTLTDTVRSVQLMTN